MTDLRDDPGKIRGTIQDQQVSGTHSDISYKIAGIMPITPRHHTSSFIHRVRLSATADLHPLVMTVRNVLWIRADKGA